MQVDAGIPVNQGTQMQTAMPAQTPAPGMQQTPNQSAGTMPSFPPQVTPGQQMMEQFLSRSTSQWKYDWRGNGYRTDDKSGNESGNWICTSYAADAF